MKALDFTLWQIRLAKRSGEKEVYFYSVGNESDFVKAISAASEVEKVVYDNNIIEPTRCPQRTKKIIQWLHRMGYNLGQGYIAILKS